MLFAVQSPKERINFEKSGNVYQDRVALVESGEDGALIRLHLIEDAQSTIDISYYIFIDGEFTDLFLKAILDAADRGVNVRILLDGMPQIIHLKGKLKEVLQGFEIHPNIALRIYEPFNLLVPWAWNNRLHDKMILVDGNFGLIGGRNIGDKYYLEEVGTSSFVKDRDVLIVKDNPLSVIDEMQHYFVAVWNSIYSKPLEKRLSEKKIEQRKVYIENLHQRSTNVKKKHVDIDWHEYTRATQSIQFMHNPVGRLHQDPWCLKALLELASQSKDSIFVQSPYIIPSRKMKTEFNQYDIDLEKISVLTNSLASSPNPVAKSAYTNHRKKIVDSGATVHEYQGPDSIHSKTYIFDDAISVIGTFNVDARSSFLHTESLVIIESEEFTKDLKREIQQDMDNSLQVAPDYSYMEDSQVEEGNVSTLMHIGVAFLSTIVFFFDYLL